MSMPQTKAPRVSVVEGRRELHDIIRTARTMEERRLNPFLMDVGASLETADRFFPAWRDIQDLVLDVRALNALSRVVKMQESRLRYQAQLFHADPEAMAEKLGDLKTDQLAKVFLEAWHPVAELEQLTPEALEEALTYWEQLEPVELRRRERPRREPPQPEALTLDDLLARGVLARNGIGSAIAELWDQLRAAGPTEYWAFVGGKSHGEKVRRAYATSYLVTYGYAWLEQRDGRLVLHPRGAQEPPQQSVSLPIVVV